MADKSAASLFMPTYSQNRGIARTYLPSFIKAGYSANYTLSVLKEVGLGYRRTDFLADWREFAGLEAKKDTFKYIRKDYRPTPATITRTTESLSKKYSYILEITGTDKITGKEITTSWRYATDELIPIKEAISVVEEELLRAEYDIGLKNYKVDVVGVKQSIFL